MRFFNLPSILMNSAGVPGPGGGGGAALSDSGSGGGESTDLIPFGGDDGQVHDGEFVDDQAVEPARTGRPEKLVENGKITHKAGRGVIEALRTSSPQYAQHVVQALLTADRFRRELPGGFRELSDLRTRIQNFGGDEGVAELKTNSDHLDRLNTLFLASNPEFINEITSESEGQVGFVGLMPSVLNRWAQLDAPGRSWWTADQFARGLDTVRMPVLVARVADILKRMAPETIPVGLVESFDEIVGALESISYQAAKNKPAAPALGPKPDEERGRLQTQAREATKEAWQTSLGAYRKDIFNSTLAMLLGGRQLKAIERQEVKGYYDMWIRPKAMERQANIDRFLTNNDKEGYLKIERAFYQKEIPIALRNAVAKLAPAGQRPRQQQQRQAPQRQAPAAPGVVRVATMPVNINVADNRNTADLLRENKAWGKDGKLYQWTR